MSTIKTNPKAFIHANKFRKTTTKISPLKTISNNTPHYVAGPLQMAEILSNQYKSVFTTTMPPPPTTPGIEELLTDIVMMSVPDMIAVLRAAVGADNITPRFLKDYAEVIAPALSMSPMAEISRLWYHAG